MKVVITPDATADLREIWDWNAKEYGIRHADSYITFLGKRIVSLSKTHAQGRFMESRPNYRYVLMRRRSSGHGHVAIYEVVYGEIIVHRVRHTSENWQ